MQEHPPQDSGGYWRSLKKKEDSKGFTLVELIVVIVILAILAAILIPGLLKWIDQAKDKKYELEAREIAMAAEAALTTMYGQGKQVSVESGKLKMGSSTDTDLMGDGPFQTELRKFTDAAVEKIEIYGNSDGGTPEKWGGSVTGFEITFIPSGEMEPITARLLPDDDRWVINPSGESSEGPDAWLAADPGDSQERQKYMRIMQAAVQAFRTKCGNGEIAAVTLYDSDKILEYEWKEGDKDINFYCKLWRDDVTKGSYGNWLTDDLTGGEIIMTIQLYGYTQDENDPDTWQGDIGRVEIIDYYSGNIITYDRDSGWIDG